MKRDLASFMDSNVRHESRRRAHVAKETQVDFGVAELCDNSRVSPAYARE